MTALLDVEPEPRTAPVDPREPGVAPREPRVGPKEPGVGPREPAVGPRERRRLEQQQRSRRRYRHASRVAAAALAVVVAVTGLLAAVAPRLGGSSEGAAPAAPAAPAPEAAPAAADPDPAADDRVRLQLLNGIGTPGIADRVEGELPEGEFRVVLADNAPEFGVRKTRLLVYDDEPASLAAAERLREVLGAGTISVSRQPQSVVDVTVIIGRDIDGS